MSETIGEDKGTIAIIDAFTGGTAGVYDGLDQFGRVQNLLWVNYGTSTNVAQIQHGYDYAGNRVWRADPIASSNSVYLDEFYTYDGLNQVTDLQRGQLNSGKTGITSTPAWEEAWTLDALGNWSGYVQNVNGATNLNQTRTHDLANKVTQINSSTTHVASDLAGSMTELPIPGNWNDHYCMVYDAWNRLVGVLASDGTTNIAQYQYDGRNFRTVKKSYSSGTLSETRHFYYNADWQCLEERLETSGVISSYANRQNVWGMRYTDDLILRDRDADGSSATGSLGLSGSGLEERLYALQDPNWNVVAVSNTTGSIQERYSYTAYGTPTFLTSAFAAQSPNSSSYAWDTLYTSRQYDSETGLYHYRMRSFGAELGRFASRDPLAADINLYRYCRNSPTIFVDPSGLWGADVHSGLTQRWAVNIALMPTDGASAIGNWDNQADTQFDPSVINDANWSWHFDRSHGGTDSRLQHAIDTMGFAKSACSQSECNWNEAAMWIGWGLHARQDYVAHGDFDAWAEAPTLAGVGWFESRHYWHNWDSPVWGSTGLPDNINMDANGPNGRPTRGVIHFVTTLSNGDRTGWTEFHAGSQRRDLTMNMTLDYLSEFMNWVSANGCCECKKKFLGKYWGY